MFSDGKLIFIENLKGENIIMKRLKRDLSVKLQRSSQMLSHREIEKLDFSFAQECSNDRILAFTTLSFFFYREDVYIGCSTDYSRHTIIRFFHITTFDCIILLT